MEQSKVRGTRRNEESRQTEPIDPTRLVGKRVAEIRRKYRVMTQEGLAEAMKAVGIRWERITVAKLEAGQRSFVKLDELLALCLVLDISLIDLLVPADLDESHEYRVTPEITASIRDVRDWLRGEAPLVTHGGRASARYRIHPTAADIAAYVQHMPDDRAREVMTRWLEQKEPLEEGRK